MVLIYLLSYHTCQENGIKLFQPKLSLCTDNAAMIASAGYYYIKNGKGLAAVAVGLIVKAEMSGYFRGELIPQNNSYKHRYKCYNRGYDYCLHMLFNHLYHLL